MQGLDVALLRNIIDQGRRRVCGAACNERLRPAPTSSLRSMAMDSTVPKISPRLITAAARHPGNIVIGARLRGRHRAPRSRRVANGFAGFWVSWAAGHRVVESPSGFRLYPAALFKRIDVAHDCTRGFLVESEIRIEAAAVSAFSTAVQIDSIYHARARPSQSRLRGHRAHRAHDCMEARALRLISSRIAARVTNKDI
jgi:hypothetical protein